MYTVKYCLDFINHDEEDKISCDSIKEAFRTASSIVRWGLWNGAQKNTSFANVYNNDGDFVLCYFG